MIGNIFVAYPSVCALVNDCIDSWGDSFYYLISCICIFRKYISVKIYLDMMNARICFDYLNIRLRLIISISSISAFISFNESRFLEYSDEFFLIIHHFFTIQRSLFSEIFLEFRICSICLGGFFNYYFFYFRLYKNFTDMYRFMKVRAVDWIFAQIREGRKRRENYSSPLTRQLIVIRIRL